MTAPIVGVETQILDLGPAGLMKLEASTEGTPFITFIGMQDGIARGFEFEADERLMRDLISLFQQALAEYQEWKEDQTQDSL